MTRVFTDERGRRVDSDGRVLCGARLARAANGKKTRDLCRARGVGRRSDGTWCCGNHLARDAQKVAPPVTKEAEYKRFGRELISALFGGDGQREPGMELASGNSRASGLGGRSGRSPL